MNPSSQIPATTREARARGKAASAGPVLVRAWRQAATAVRWIGDSWLGDLLGALSLFACLYVLLILAAAVQP